MKQLSVAFIGVLFSCAYAHGQISPSALPTSTLILGSDAPKKLFNPNEQILTKYYGINRKEVKNIQEAAFYREFKQVAEKLYQVCEYRMDKKPSMELYVTNTAYDIKNGPFRLYYANGTIIDNEGMYKNDVQDGKWFYYHPNGLLSGREIYEDGLLVDAAYFNEDGSALKDITLSVREKPSFPGGVVEMDRFVQKVIELPEEVVKNKIVGKMAIGFYVETDGTLTNPKIELSLNRALDEAAFKVLDVMPKWTPAKAHNRLVRAKYTMPIVITLRAK
ncbi:energy transducer TonB [Emticicia sp. SJ17W-69]|uniref:energy transducer TonB n=1 Tax=Emticicia sp. SJ17W-69 TaxID=3421657 RepID=UPI003EB6D9F6